MLPSFDHVRQMLHPFIFRTHWIWRHGVAGAYPTGCWVTVGYILEMSPVCCSFSLASHSNHPIIKLHHIKCWVSDVASLGQELSLKPGGNWASTWPMISWVHIQAGVHISADVSPTVLRDGFPFSVPLNSPSQSPLSPVETSPAYVSLSIVSCVLSPLSFHSLHKHIQSARLCRTHYPWTEKAHKSSAITLMLLPARSSKGQSLSLKTKTDCVPVLLEPTAITEKTSFLWE